LLAANFELHDWSISAPLLPGGDPTKAKPLGRTLTTQSGFINNKGNFQDIMADDGRVSLAVDPHPSDPPRTFARQKIPYNHDVTVDQTTHIVVM
jgi:hypothetical protein